MWYAVNIDGEACAFQNKPTRNAREVGRWNIKGGFAIPIPRKEMIKIIGRDLDWKNEPFTDGLVK